MGASRLLGAALGAAALLAGTAAAVFDAPVVGAIAGAAGAGAAAVLAAAGSSLDRRLQGVAAGRQELETAVAAANERAAEAEAAYAALEASHAEHDLAIDDPEALLDPETGLYDGRFFGVTLASRVAAARRHLRPVAVVLLEVAAGVKDGHPEVAEAALVSTHVQRTLREADTACHLEGSRFGLVLEDTPENGAVWTVERVRRALNVARKDLTLWAGVACYPAHAFDADELLARATAALDAAREWRQDRIEVATTSEV